MGTQIKVTPEQLEQYLDIKLTPLLVEKGYLLAIKFKRLGKSVADNGEYVHFFLSL